jgi:hypothetical protein
MKWLVAFLGLGLVLTTGTASSADDSADLDVAKTWLMAAARDGARLEAATAFPFTYRTTNKIKRCERAVRDAAAFSKWAMCFQKGQKLLLDEVRAGTNLQVASTRDAEPRELRALAETIPGDGRWLRAFINGDGVSFIFFFRVTETRGGDKVTALVLQEEVENG